MEKPKGWSPGLTEKTTITGDWASRRVWIGPKELLPGTSQKVCNHSPDGFNWGYEGSGPAQLALAILLDLTHDQSFSIVHYQAFKSYYITRLPQGNFILPFSAVKTWIDEARLKEKTK